MAQGRGDCPGKFTVTGSAGGSQQRSGIRANIDIPQYSGTAVDGQSQP